MSTKAQKKARQRNFNIFRLRGVVSILRVIKNKQTDLGIFDILNITEKRLTGLLQEQIKNIK